MVQASMNSENKACIHVYFLLFDRINNIWFCSSKAKKLANLDVSTMFLCAM